MHYDKALFERYLQEVQSLEAFRLRYLSRHQEAPLDREDPHVQRLIEALAFFNASARHTLHTQNLGMTRRIFQQYFSYLLDALPAMGMLRAEVTGRFVETAHVPAGTAVEVTAGETVGGFATTRPLRILPIRLTQVERIPRIVRGHRLLLRFRSSYERNDEPGELALYLNHLNDFYSSLVLQEALREHITGCSVAYGENVTSQTEGQACAFDFGAPGRARGEAADRFQHPLERIRSFFHVPEQEFFLNVKVPPPPHMWDRFTIIFDLSEGWPKTLAIDEDSFALNVTPIINIKRANAEPIMCDGTRTRFPIIYPDAAEDYELHSVRGIYTITENGYRPIKPGILPGGGNSYEVELRDEGERSRCSWLALRLPDSFERPCEVAVDACWHQPWLSENLDERLEVSLYDRALVGLDWQLVGKVAPTRDNAIKDSVETLLELLSIRMKTRLSREELALILRALSSIEASPFSEVPRLIDKVEIDKLPGDSDSDASLKLRYRFELIEFEDRLLPLVKAFFVYAHQLLNVWIPDTVCEAQVKLPRDAGKLEYR